MSRSARIASVLLLAAALPIAIGLSSHFFADLRFESESLHAFLEVAGGCTAVAVGLLLITRVRRGDAPHLTWAIGSLIGMGILDLAHGAWHYGTAWSWLRAMATLTGGVLFALVWLPQRFVPKERRRFFVRCMAWGAGAMVGAIVVLAPYLPPMWDVTGKYSLWTRGLNSVGGLGFIAASIFFFRRYLRTGAPEDLLFASHTLMFASASSLIWFSRNWYLEWWFWHVLRTTSYGIVVIAAYRHVNEMQKKLQLQNEHLEAAVSKRTHELRQAQRDLQQANAELEQKVAERTGRLRETVADLEAFSYSIAHDMRAPLRSMRGFAAVLEADYGERLDAPAKGYLARIGASAERLDRLIRDVLDYSKIVRGELPMERVDSHKLISEIIDSYPDFQAPQVEVSIAEDLPPVRANQAALTQVVSNLLGNAVKFVAPGVKPKVSIRATDDGNEHLRFWFEDNGIGISPSGQQRLFQMFQRLNPPGHFDGTGIGLAIVRKAVERMGGRVGVQSEPGKGSRFWVELKKEKG